MTLLARVVGRLAECGIPCALIGAEALALRGQTRILRRSAHLDLGEVTIAVPSAADLVLLKLYAAGPQDAWDIAQLLNADDREALVGEVAARVGELPEDCRHLWEKLLLA